MGHHRDTCFVDGDEEDLVDRGDCRTSSWTRAEGRVGPVSSVTITEVSSGRATAATRPGRRGIDLSGEDLRHCNLTDANLAYASLERINAPWMTAIETDLYGACLNHAYWLSPIEAASATVGPGPGPGTNCGEDDMANEIDVDAFVDYEASGFDRVADAYHQCFGPLTGRVAEPLLDAARAGVGQGLKQYLRLDSVIPLKKVPAGWHPDDIT